MPVENSDFTGDGNDSTKSKPVAVGKTTTDEWSGTCGIRPAGIYMCAMMFEPNSLHLISVAPVIWRAKS